MRALTNHSRSAEALRQLPGRDSSLFTSFVSVPRHQPPTCFDSFANVLEESTHGENLERRGGTVWRLNPLKEWTASQLQAL
jgi:hypothetical protein